MLFSEPLQSIRELALKVFLTARLYFCNPGLMDSFCLLEFLGESFSENKQAKTETVDVLYQFGKAFSTEAVLSLSAFILCRAKTFIPWELKYSSIRSGTSTSLAVLGCLASSLPTLLKLLNAVICI